MSGQNVSTLKEHMSVEAHQDERNTRRETMKYDDRSVSRFPSVESVLREIDASYEMRGYVA